MGRTTAPDWRRSGATGRDEPVSETFDFERYWLSKLALCLDEMAGAEIRAAVMAGSEGLSDASPRREVIAWSRFLPVAKV